MSERKVLNKYYPPDFDPSKIPKLKGAKVNRQWSIRIMAPFNMRCNTCGEYIYKGKKFNSKKETLDDDDYLGLKIFRFYIKCPRCVAEIAFKTDPENCDYALEAGATRNFEAARTAEELAKKEIAAKEADEANNPMKVLENRTKASMAEMEMIETLEELKEMNSRHAKVDFENMLGHYKVSYEEQLKKLQDDQDEEFVNSLFGKNADMVVKRIHDDDDDNLPVKKRIAKGEKATDILIMSESSTSGLKSCSSGGKSTLSGMVKPKTSLSGLVKPKATLAGLVKPKSCTLVKKCSATVSKVESDKEDNKESIVGTNGNSNDKNVVNNDNRTDDGNSCFNKKPLSLNSKNDEVKEEKEVDSTLKTNSAIGGLGLLGNYSDSTSDSD